VNSTSTAGSFEKRVYPANRRQTRFRHGGRKNCSSTRDEHEKIRLLRRVLAEHAPPSRAMELLINRAGRRSEDQTRSFLMAMNLA